VAQSKRIADGHHEIAHPGILGIGQLDGSELGSIDLDDRNVRRRIGADHLGGKGPIVLHRDGNFVSVLYDVGIGDDITILGVHDDAGTGALGATPLGLVGLHLEKATKEGVVEKRIAIRLHLNASACRDVDHRGGDPLNHRCERGQVLAVDLGWQRRTNRSGCEQRADQQ